MQSAACILYLYGAQVVHRFIFLLCFFFALLGGDVVADDDIVGIFPDLEGGARRVFGIERRQPRRDVGTGNIVGSQQDRIEIEPYLRLRTVVGDVGTADKLLLVELITHIFRHQLHDVEVGAFYHDPLLVLADAEQAHEAAQPAHCRAVATSSSTAYRFVNGYFDSLDIG